MNLLKFVAKIKVNGIPIFFWLHSNGKCLTFPRNDKQTQSMVTLVKFKSLARECSPLSTLPLTFTPEHTQRSKKYNLNITAISPGESLMAYEQGSNMISFQGSRIIQVWKTALRRLLQSQALQLGRYCNGPGERR